MMDFVFLFYSSAIHDKVIIGCRDFLIRMLPKKLRVLYLHLIERPLELVTSLCVLSFIVLFIFQGASGSASLSDDASQNLRSAFNLFSTGEYGEFRLGVPGFRREPLPNFITAFYIKSFVWQAHDLNFSSLRSAQDVLDQIVRVNLLWAFGLYVSLWCLCRQLFRPSWIANIIAAFAIYGSDSVFVAYEYRNLNTELQASCLLVVFISLSLIFYRSSSLWMALPVGFLAGLVILTKASGIYVFPIAFLPLALLFSKRLKLPGLLSKRFTRYLAVLVVLYLSTSLTVLPWMMRNKIEFNEVTISQGGGRILWIRSEFNKMNSNEYFGSFYAYSPSFLQVSVFEDLLGFKEAQLECGGSLQSLNRNLLCDRQSLDSGNLSQVRSFYQRGKRVRPALVKTAYKREGLAFDNDDVGKKFGINSIINNPVKHFFVTLPIAWRGLWSFKDESFGGVLINFIGMFGLVAILPVFGLLRYSDEWLVISLIPTGYFWFYAFLSHFRTRYSEPLIPLSFIALFLLLTALLSTSRKHFKSVSGTTMNRAFRH